MENQITERKTIYDVTTAEAQEILIKRNIPCKDTINLRRWRKAGKLSAEERADASNNNRITVYYNREELNKFNPNESVKKTPVLTTDELIQTETGLEITRDLSGMLSAIAGFAHVVQQTQSANEKILNLTEAAKESGLKKPVIKAAIEQGLIVARKGNAVRRVLKGKEYTSYNLMISKVSLLNYAYNFLRESEPIQLSKSATG
jgi:hypothetical protein